jgi:putative membrane-bound dehydrogenase-like protein
MPRRIPVTPPWTSVALALVVSLLPAGLLFAEDQLGVTVPEGFEVTLFADDDLAHDIYSVTVDSFGRVVVSGAGYVRILNDTDADGRADAFLQYADGPKSGAQGMYFYGRDLICAGDGGLIRYRDRNADDRADGPPDLFLKVKAGGEHDLHAMRKGPDGYWYVIAGNMAGVTKDFVTIPTSPVKEPHGGVVLRLSPDLRQGEVYCHGFRNAYDFDFGAMGDVFVFDSDGERDISLPWYRPTRLFHMTPGSHAGWITESWKRPDEFLDMPPVIGAFGRGSPTGVVCYKHTQFPDEYRGGVFILDWTYGRVLAIPLTRSGSTWSGEAIEFITAVGQHGFAPTDAEVGPDGSLYIAVGGRGTRGSVYRVRWTGAPPVELPRVDVPLSPQQKLSLVLSSPQPLSSWSRRRWEPLADALGRSAFAQAALEERRDPFERIRAIEILTEKFQGLEATEADRLASSISPDVRARAVWSIGRTQRSLPNLPAIVRCLTDQNPYVARAAAEALYGAQQDVFGTLVEPIAQALASRDPTLRQSAARLLPLVDEDTYHAVAAAAIQRGWQGAVPVAQGFALRKPGFNAYTIDIGIRALEGRQPAALRLEAARLIQIGLGDLVPAETPGGPVFEGYVGRVDLSEHAAELEPLVIRLLALYPSGDAAVDYELVRVLAMLQPDDSAVIDRLLAGITDQTHPTDDIHRLIALARLPAKRSESQRTSTAAALLAIDEKVRTRQLRQDNHWTDRIMELYAGLVERDAGLPEALLAQPAFGRPGHVQFVAAMPEQKFPEAIGRFVEAVQADGNYRWDQDVVFLLGASNDPQVRNMLREKFDDYSLRNAILLTLSRDPVEIDRPLYLEGLDGTPFDVMGACIASIAQLPPDSSPREIVTLVRTARKLGYVEEERELRDQVIELLRLKTGQQFPYVLGAEGDPQQAAIDEWTAWVEAQYPDEFAAQSGASLESTEQLAALLAQVDWELGDASRGEKLFQTRQCSQCHNSRSALGPDLTGVAGRFSRDDLFIAIALPNKDVSPRYMATTIATSDGTIHTGMIVYESVDGLVLRDAQNRTLRIETEEIDSRRTRSQSLMPAGLLKDLQPSDLADLYAYLRGLGLQTANAGGQ